MVTATSWVPRGFAAPFPTKYVFDEEEYGRIAKLAKLQLDDAQEDLEEARAGKKETADEGAEDVENGTAVNGNDTGKTESQEEIDDDLNEYDLEHYDDDVAEDQGDSLGMFGNMKSLVYHENDEDDPYITMKEDDEEDEEREELQILATDNLLLAARIEDEVAHLEVYVYEDDADNLYVHHDIMLPAIPLAVEWFDVPVGKAGASQTDRGNFVAVGTMDPDIELWDLDTVDCMYPNAILGAGGEELAAAKSETTTEHKPKRKKKRSKKMNDAYHIDAVLSLAANRHHRNLLASSSADKTIKLWDLNTTTCAKSYNDIHTDKICSLAWHPTESTVLLSGAYDRTVAAADMRAPDAAKPRWGVESDVESVRWDPHDPNYFYIATESGVLHLNDARMAPKTPEKTKPVWTLQAHDQAVSAFDVNPVIPGFLVTGSTDKQVKIWNVEPGGGPSMVVSRDHGVGRVFSTNFAPDKEVGFRLAVAGSKGTVQVWDTSTNGAVRRTFAERVKLPALAEGEVKERVTRMAADDEESDDEDNGDGAGARADHEGWESMEE